MFNATPMGMEDGDPLPIDTTLLTASMFVGNVIAGHGETPFIKAAQEVGCKVADGVQIVEAGQDLMADFMLGNSSRSRSGQGSGVRAIPQPCPSAFVVAFANAPG